MREQSSDPQTDSRNICPHLVQAVIDDFMPRVALLDWHAIPVQAGRLTPHRASIWHGCLLWWGLVVVLLLLLLAGHIPVAVRPLLAV